MSGRFGSHHSSFDDHHDGLDDHHCGPDDKVCALRPLVPALETGEGRTGQKTFFFCKLQINLLVNRMQKICQYIYYLFYYNETIHQYSLLEYRIHAFQNKIWCSEDLCLSKTWRLVSRQVDNRRVLPLILLQALKHFCHAITIAIAIFKNASLTQKRTSFAQSLPKSA